MTGGEIRKTVLPNGLCVVTERIQHVRSVSLGVWVRAGAETDSMNATGMAHFVEHMLFKGTQKRNTFEIADAVESRGGALNAFTERDLTCYFATVLSEDVETAVDVIADMITNALLSTEDIEREKSVVIEEIHSAGDVPEELAQDIFGDAVLSPNPVSKSVLGTVESIQSIAREDVVKYISRHYQGRTILVAAAGALEHEKIVQSAASCFSFDNSEYDIVTHENKNVFAGNITVLRDIQQAHVCVGTRTFGYDSERRNALRILVTVLGGGMSSRLFQLLRERHGLCYSVYTYTELMKSLGFIATYAATEKENLPTVLSMIDEEHRRLTFEEMDNKTIDHVKSQLKGSLILGMENTSNRMSRIARHELYLGYHPDIDDTIRMMESVGASQIRELAGELFNKDAFRTVVVTYS